MALPQGCVRVVPVQPSDLSTSVEKVKLFSHGSLGDSLGKIVSLKDLPAKCTLIVGVNTSLQGTKDGFFESHKNLLAPFLFDFDGSLNATATCFNIGGFYRIVIVGTGNENSSEAIRAASATAATAARNAKSTVLIFETFGNNPQSIAEGALLGLYKFDVLKSEPTNQVSEIHFIGSTSDIEKWNVGATIAQSQNIVRRLAELPANYATPTYFAKQAQELFKSLPNVTITVRDAQWAEKEKMFSFLSVAQGSDEPPKFVEIHYNGGGDSAPIVFVGKGVTFDSGGISIKGAEKMGDMRGDCGGAASVFGVLLSVAKLGLKVNVIGITPLTENMPSGKATKPADVVFASNGKSIEIDNTDAEGRLILADALVYVCKNFKPKMLIDLATLTGSVSLALGHHFSGAFTNSKPLWKSIKKAGIEANEPFWRLPIPPHYRKNMNSSLADIKNTGGRYGGAINGAVFLSEFVTVDRWAHLDIASTAHPQPRDSPYVPSNAMTGMPMRAMVQLVQNEINL